MVTLRDHPGRLTGGVKHRRWGTRRLCTIARFYRYAVEEELLDHSPGAHVRRPRLDYESHAAGLDRNELGALLVAAGLGLRSLACLKPGSSSIVRSVE